MAFANLTDMFHRGKARAVLPLPVCESRVINGSLASHMKTTSAASTIALLFGIAAQSHRRSHHCIILHRSDTARYLMYYCDSASDLMIGGLTIRLMHAQKYCKEALDHCRSAACACNTSVELSLVTKQ